MQRCIHRGCHTEGILPGGLGVYRRAAGIHRGLMPGQRDPAQRLGRSRGHRCLAGGGPEQSAELFPDLALGKLFRVGGQRRERGVWSSGHGADQRCGGSDPGRADVLSLFLRGTVDGIEDFLLTAGVIGMLFKKGATISAAMGGCQAEIGVSSAMAAAGLCQVLGGSVGQVLMAAEIAMEHHLGMTCDPVGGLVQVPCIERNAMGATKALTACYLALESDPTHARVPLDAVIRSMWATAQDMSSKYKETSEGGLAVLIPVSHPACDTKPGWVVAGVCPAARVGRSLFGKGADLFDPERLRTGCRFLRKGKGRRVQRRSDGIPRAGFHCRGLVGIDRTTRSGREVRRLRRSRRRGVLDHRLRRGVRRTIQFAGRRLQVGSETEARRNRLAGHRRLPNPDCRDFRRSTSFTWR
jgi:L-serine deaminase